MSTSHLSELIPAVCAGLGLLLTGLANLLLLRSGGVARLAGSGAAAGVAVAVAASLDQPGVAGQTLLYLVVGLTPVVLLECRPVVRTVAAVLGFLTGRTAVRHTLLTAAGVTVVVASIVSFDQEDQRLLDESVAELELLSGYTPSHPTRKVHALTDRGRPVTLQEPETPRETTLLAEAERKTLESTRLLGAVIRRGEANDLCNCHGWVFTGGMFLISGSEVDTILEDNGYVPVDDPRPGDLVVYRTNGTVAHTAVVRYVTEGQPVLVEGKWGHLGVFLHPVDQSVYGTNYTFYRTQRPGHLLRGLDSRPTDVAGTTATADEE